MRVLYVSYDGALEPLGQSQVVPYLRGLAHEGAGITLMSYEKPASLRHTGAIAALRSDLVGHGVRWIPLRYHKRPSAPATAFDVLVGFARGLIAIRRDRVTIVHARSYVAALVAWLLQRVCRVRFVFDMRGFWVDERVDGGLLPAGGMVYRTAKRFERVFLRDADAIVTLTERARETLRGWGVTRPVTVIPTCVDLERYAPAKPFTPREQPPVFIYAGSLGTWYALAEMVRFIEEAAARFPGTRFIVLSHNAVEAEAGVRASGVRADAVTIATAAPRDVPAWLARADAGLAFYRPGFARQATCPTKVGEYLAMGLPVAVNSDVGDMKAIVAGNGVGTALEEFSTDAYAQALTELEKLWADPTLPERCRRVAATHFGLEHGIARYKGIYERLA